MKGYLSRQITIIPKPELRGFGGHFPYFSPPFGVTSAEVAIICPDLYSRDVLFFSERWQVCKCVNICIYIYIFFLRLFLNKSRSVELRDMFHRSPFVTFFLAQTNG